LSQYHLLPALYVAAAAVMVLWDIVVAGRVSQLRRAPRTFAAITAFGGLLIVPALLIAYAASSILYGRAIQPVAWVWPVTAVLFALQATYALSRRLVTPLFGIPIFVYDVIIAIVAVSRYAMSHGFTPPDFGFALSAAQANALGFFFGAPALWAPQYLVVPLMSPSLPARWRFSRVIRMGVAAAAAAIAGLIIVLYPQGFKTNRSYAHYAKDQLQEHPEGDFTIGLKIFPDLKGPPPPLALERDGALADSLQIGAVAMTLTPEGARLASLDSIARTVDDRRADSTLIIIALGYSADAAQQFRASPAEYTRKRVADVDRIARRLRPDILIPAVDPYGDGARALGTQPPEYWIDYLTRAARIAHGVNRRIRIGVAASSFGSRDSTLYFWAANRQSPVDIVGFSMMPGFLGATSLDTDMRIATRWMHAQGTRIKPHWVFSTGGYPVAHGEESQALAIWGVMAWATSQAPIKGAIVTEAGDYNVLRGLRNAGGRYRSAVIAVMRAEKGLKETVAPQ
jgi:NADH:ubiquinone oxidoreductase subunit K